MEANMDNLNEKVADKEHNLSTRLNKLNNNVQR